MGDMGEAFREVNAILKEEQNNRYAQNLKYLMAVKGFVVTKLTPYQYRVFGEGVGNFIDIYPTNARYHNIVTNERGRYKTIQGFLKAQLDRTSQFILERQEGDPNESI